MIIKRVGLKKLNVNGAKCLFDHAELVYRQEEIFIENNMMYNKKVNEWNIEIENAKSHVNFEFMFNLDVKMNIKLETIEGDKMNAKGIVNSFTSSIEKYEELDIELKEKDWIGVE